MVLIGCCQRRRIVSQAYLIFLVTITPAVIHKIKKSLFLSEQASTDRSYATGKSLSTVHGYNASFEQSAEANNSFGMG